jgi:hypothetical protein
MHWVCNVKYESGHKLMLTFEDGSIRVADLADHLDGEVFEPLRDVRRFKRVRLNPDLDTVVWDNGADMSPDFLYEIGIPVDVAREPARFVAEGKASYGDGKKKL